jgi:predicted GIY-YIG superfamily endonuclease
MLRDKLVGRLREMGNTPDHQRLAAEVLGIRGASPDLARRLVAQALVVEDRRDVWRRAGERIAASAPRSAGVYVLRDLDRRALYVGKAINLRRRLRAHFAERRWRAIKPEMSRAADADWIEVGSEVEALLREAALIHELQPIVNIQTGPPDLSTRSVPRALVRDIIVVVPSVEEDSAELVGARADGGWFMQRTRRSGADLLVHTNRLLRFFRSPLRRGFDGASLSTARGAPLPLAPALRRSSTSAAGADSLSSRGPQALAPIVFSWLAGRGANATRLDPHDGAPRVLRARLAAVLRDERLFVERLDQRVTR